MRTSHLAVAFPVKGLPRNAVHACGALWTQTSRMLLPGLGVILPDCSIYYAERKRSIVERGLEKSIESAPADYALCMVTLEQGEDRHGV